MERLKRLLFAQNFATNCILIFPLYSIMFADRGHLSISQINVLYAIWVAVALIAEVPTGIIADRYSRKAVLVWSELLKGAGYLLWLVQPTFWGFAAGFAISGVGYALESGAYQAFIYDELAAKEQQKQYAKVLTMTTTAMYAGMLVAYVFVTPLIAHWVNYVPLLWASIAMNIVAAIVMAAIPHAPPLREETPKKHLELLRDAAGFVWRSPVVLRTMLWLGVVGGLIGWFEEYISLFERTAGVATRWIPLALASSLALYIVLNWIPHRLTNTKIVARTGLFVLGGFSLISASLFKPALLVIIGATVCSMVWRWLRIIFDVDLQEQVPSGVRATASSIAALAAELFTIAVSLVFAWLSHHYSSALSVRYLLLGVLAAWSIVLLVMYSKHSQQPQVAAG